MALRDSTVLLPYQRRWLNDRARIKVWVASRQIGKSFALSLEALTEALMTRSDNLILSASERQAQEVMKKVRAHISVMKPLSGGLLSPARETREEIELSHGSRIISLPANPSTVRGFSGNIYLDEFAFHSDSRQIWRAMYPSVTRGYKVRVTSTPNGKLNMFHELARGRGALGEGAAISRHRTTVHEAIEAGLDMDLGALRSGITDPEAWQQEYECVFLDAATALITYEMLESCESGEATAEFVPANTGGELYLGVDIGRKHDMTVMWMVEKLGDVLWTRMVRVMRGETFAAQREALYTLMDMNAPRIRRACIDSTGIGAQLAEESVKKYGHRVEPVHFTPATKEDMALRVRRAFEERSLRIPVSREIREDIHSLGRSVSQSGATRYSAPRSSAGHADRFWALALALEAAGQGASGEVAYSSVEGRERPMKKRGW